MAPMVLADVMEELARRIREYGESGIFLRSYGWPNPSVSAPAFVVGYPPQVDLDTAMQRGADRAAFPCWAVFGAPEERSSRDNLSEFLQAIKDATDGPAAGIWSSARAQSIIVETVSNDDGTEFLAARFTVDVVT